MSNAFQELLLYTLLVGVISIVAWVGQWGRTNRFARYAVLGLIGVSGGILMLLGGLMIAAGKISAISAQLPANFPNMIPTGTLLFLMGICAVPSLIPPFRRFLARTVFPGLDVSAPVHTWSLYVYMAALVLTLMTITVLYNPALIIESLRQMSLPITAALNALSFVVFAFVASGLWIWKPFKETAVDLGLTGLTGKQIGQMIGLALLLAVGIQGVEWLLHPFMSAEMKNILDQIGAAMHTSGSVGYTIAIAVVVGLSAGIGEEILFRGLMQPVFGIVPAALLFTLVHTHYGPSVLLFELLIIGLILGYVRHRINTTAAIVVHAAFDFFAIMSSLLPK